MHSLAVIVRVVHLCDLLVAHVLPGPDRLRTVVIVFAYISFVELGLILVLTALNPRARQWPGTLSSTRHIV